MVQRTKYGAVVNSDGTLGEVVEGDGEGGYVLNVKPFRYPLFLIFLQYNRDLLDRLEALPKVFYCRSGRVENFIHHCHHIIVRLDKVDIDKVRQLVSDVSCKVVAIDLDGSYRDSKLLDSLFRLNFKGKSDNFIFEYLKEFLRVEG